MNQQNEFKETSRKIKEKSIHKSNLFKFLMKVDGQEYGNEIIAWKSKNFLLKPGSNTELPISFSNLGFTRFYKGPKLEKENKFPLERKIAQDYNQAFDEALDRKTPQAIVDYNRENYFGTNPQFTTQGKIENFEKDFNKIAEPVKNWIDHNPKSAPNVFCLQCEFIAYSETNQAFYVTTKNGNIKSIKDDDPAYDKLDKASKAFFKKIREDQLRFKIEDKELSLSEMLDSGISPQTIISKIKEEMAKDEVLKNYQPNFLTMVNLEICVGPLDMNKGKLTEFAYEHSKLLAHNPNEALMFLQENVEFFAAPFHKGESFQAWAKSLNKEEIETLTFISNTNKKLIEIGKYDKEIKDEYKLNEYKGYTDALIGDSFEKKPGLLHGHQKNMEDFLLEDNRRTPLILELKDNEPVSKLIESWNQWNEKQKIKEWEEKISPYQGKTSNISREPPTDSERRWIDIKRILNRTDRFDELAIVFQEYKRILNKEEYEDLFSPKHLSKLNEGGLNELKMVELYIKIEDVKKQIQYIPFSLDFNMIGELEKIQNNIKTDYQANRCSPKQYQDHLEKIKGLYLTLEQKVVENTPALENNNVNGIIAFFKRLWAGFRNLLVGQYQFEKKEEEKRKPEYFAPERKALGTLSTFQGSFFNSQSSKARQEPDPSVKSSVTLKS